ncbi:MAG: hypothetical protein MRZ79_06370 [Bacteroidia bacterium]|nr:hypothetical protein [Bacteroidia bacterium]
MKQKYRYPGIKPFSFEDKEVFHGRGEALNIVLNNLQYYKLLVLHGKSGMGKTSLIEAGIIPELKGSNRSEEISNGLTPIKIRLTSFSHENPRTPLEIFHEIVEAQIGDSSQNIPDIPDLGPNPSIWQSLKKLEMVKGENYLIIFDQFEELLSYPYELIEEFAFQLGELYDGCIPDSVKRNYELATHLSDDFEALYGDLNERVKLESELDLHILISIRSDRLNLLHKICHLVPDLLNNIYEIKPLNREEAIEAICVPAESDELGFISQRFSYSKDALKEILENLDKDKDGFIEPTQLQIVCQEIENRVIDQKLAKIEKEDFLKGGFEQIFGNHLKNQLKNLGKKAEIEQAVKSLVHSFLYETEEGFQRTIYTRVKGTAKKSDQKISKDQLKKLEKIKLIKKLDNQRKDIDQYELSHDTLIKPLLSLHDGILTREAADKATEDLKMQLGLKKIELDYSQQKLQSASYKVSFQKTVLKVLVPILIIAMVVSGAFFIWNTQLKDDNNNINKQLNQTQAEQARLRDSTIVEAKIDSLKEQLFISEAHSREKDSIILKQRSLLSDIASLNKILDSLKYEKRKLVPKNPNTPIKPKGKFDIIFPQTIYKDIYNPVNFVGGYDFQLNDLNSYKDVVEFKEIGNGIYAKPFKNEFFTKDLVYSDRSSNTLDIFTKSFYSIKAPDPIAPAKVQVYRGPNMDKVYDEKYKLGYKYFIKLGVDKDFQNAVNSVPKPINQNEADYSIESIYFYNPYHLNGIPWKWTYRKYANQGYGLDITDEIERITRAVRAKRTAYSPVEIKIEIRSVYRKVKKPDPKYLVRIRKSVYTITIR